MSSGEPAGGLRRFEFVAHVYVAASGPHARAGYDWVTALWQELEVRFGIAQPIGAFAAVPPTDPSGTSEGMVAARAAPGAGQLQAVLRRIHDVLCLSVVVAPPGADATFWTAIDAKWTAALPAHVDAVLGSARILQAQLADPAEPVDALDTVVDGLVGVAGDWARHGIVRAERSWGPFAVWEAADRPVADDRVDRRLVVVAGHDREAELSAWTWTYQRDLPPLARYLLHAAKVRYELRLWAADTGRPELRRETDRAIAHLLRLADEVRDGAPPNPAALLDASVPLIRLQAGELGLVDRASRLRDTRRSVQIAAANMAAHAGGDQARGLFADDKTLAEWLQRQLDHDAAFLESAAERARTVAALGDQLVTRGLAGRQERVSLGLTGAIGAVLMTLAAIQSFGYQVPLDPPVKEAVVPPLIATLGAVALALSMIVLRTAAPRRRLPVVAFAGSVGVLAAALVWLGIAVGTAVAAIPPPTPALTTAWAGAGALAAGLGAFFLLSRR